MPLSLQILLAALSVVGALVFLGLVLWGARQDGREQRSYDEALRRYRERDER